MITAELDARLVALANAIHRHRGSLDREDLQQIAREHALKVLAKTRAPTVAYVLTAVRWRILDAYRAEERSYAVPMDPIVFTGHDHGDNLGAPFVDDFADATVEELDRPARVDDLLTVGAAIDELPLDKRAIVVLMASGLTTRETAAVLGIPRGTVASRAFRAHAVLRARIAA